MCVCARPAGCAGLQPTVAAIKAGKDICLANKETLIAGGPYVLPLAAEYGVNILPADSEHSVRAPGVQGSGTAVALFRLVLTTPHLARLMAHSLHCPLCAPKSGIPGLPNDSR